MNINCPTCHSSEFTFVTYPKKNIPNYLTINNVAICKKCDHGFTQPMPDQTLLNKYYEDENYWEDVNQTLYNYFFYQSCSRVKKVMQASTEITSEKKLKVLDIGAGYGLIGKSLHKYSKNLEYHFTEPDNRLAEKILKEQQSSKRHLRLEEISEKYDLIFLNHVLEQVETPTRFLEKIANIASDATLFYLEVPNQDHKFKDALFPHLHFFSSISLENTLKKSGFKVRELNVFGKLYVSSLRSKVLSVLLKVSHQLKLEALEYYLASKIYGLDKVNAPGSIWIYAICQKN